MAGQAWYEILWALVNSPAGIAVIAGAFAFGLNKLYAVRPLWQAWEGTIISGVKMAEKMIPDDTDNKSLAKADMALQFVVKAFEAAKGRQASQKEVVNLAEGISLVHAVMEEAGTLRKPEAEVGPEMEG